MRLTSAVKALFDLEEAAVRLTRKEPATVPVLLSLDEREKGSNETVADGSIVKHDPFQSDRHGTFPRGCTAV